MKQRLASQAIPPFSSKYTGTGDPAGAAGNDVESARDRTSSTRAATTHATDAGIANLRTREMRIENQELIMRYSHQSVLAVIGSK